VSVDYFDAWYTDMRHYPKDKDALFQALLGLPNEIQSTSLLGWAGLLEVQGLLALGDGDLLVDMACGRGGYGMWLARQSGARVVGVDFSAAAVEMACERAGLFGLASDRAEFRVGRLDASGLPGGTADALLCVDAVGFAEDIVGVASEFRRVLRPGGLVVVTGWEARDRQDGSLSERVRRADLAAQLATAGMTDVLVEERPEWTVLERELWTAAVDIDPGDDPALAALRDEARRVLPTLERMRRVIATASSPQEREGPGPSP
jgi:SAM-dependent methyltransferase